MNFSSPEFLFAFLPAVITLYFVFPHKLKNIWLLLASIGFYAWGAPKVVLLLIILSFLDYKLAPSMKSKNKLALVAGIAANVALLLYFKYTNFFLSQVGIPHENILLPIGISFFTFQKISFLIDIHRGEAELPQSFVNYLLFVSLFPQLIAGPIVRFKDIYKQIESRLPVPENKMLVSGIVRFSQGLAKKVLIADYVAVTADKVFGTEVDLLSPTTAWLGLTCYAIQIYFDFSGYSDMAIGLGRIFGFDLLENFNKPYKAKSFTEFWKRWHISLSRWMRDYLYIPLGGNRLSPARTYFNLWVVFVISGFWHGAEWTFLVWGVYHGFFLVLERAGLGRLLSKLPAIVGHAYLLIGVLIGWVFFRAESLSYAWAFIQRLFSLQTHWNLAAADLEITNRALTMLCIAIVLSFTKMKANYLSGAFLVMSVVAVFSSSYSPFIYFRF